MTRLLLTAMVVLLSGCAAMMHKPDVSIGTGELEATGVCALNVVDTASMFDPVILKACARGPVQLTVLFGTMHNETATPANWRVRVWDPAGELVLDADNLAGTPHIGQCGTGGCSKEALVEFKLPQPWTKGAYTIECQSKLPPAHKALFHITVT